MLLFVPGRDRKVRLHSKTLVGGRMSGLLCLMAAVTAGSGVVRIAITKKILKEAESFKLSTTKPEDQRKVKERFRAVKESFELPGLIDETKKTWRESRFKQIEEQDRATIRAVLENGDDILLTPTPQTLPNWLKSIDVIVSTPHEFLNALCDKVPGPDPDVTRRMLTGVLWNHREATGLSDDSYDAFLRSEGLEPLIRILPRKGPTD